MRRVFIFTLALWAGLSNFAYASAKIDCIDKMERQSCAVPSSCDCSIQAPNEQTTPTQIHVLIEKPDVTLLPVISPVIIPADFRFEKEPFESPPKQAPLYQLFSVYRI